MNRKLLSLLSLPALLASCGLGADGDVDVTVEVEAGLADAIQVISARSAKPGTTNPVEAVIVLENKSGAGKRLKLEGTWHDGGGGFFGGTSAVWVLAPGQSDTFSAGSRSGRVTAFRLAVSETDSTQSELLTETLANSQPKAEGHGITYTETPKSEQIPPWSVRGVANGAPFTAETIMFVPNGAQWRLEISDASFDPLKGAGIARYSQKDLQTVYLDLAFEPESGAVYDREMAYGGGHFQIKTSPSAQRTTSWNTSIAWAIEFSAWDRRPWSEGGRTFQQAGTASGKLYIAFKGSKQGLANSWISGTFENAPIVYYGKPKL
jgi:hypothetical protein